MSKTLKEKWALVRDHYEKAYKVKFKVKPNDLEIEKLWRSLQELKRTYFIYNKKLN